MSLDKKKVIDIFTTAQKTSGVHQKNAIALNNIVKQADEDEFMEIFIKFIINKILIEKKNIYIERAMEFIATFCASLQNKKMTPSDEDDESETEHPIIKRTLFYLLKASSASKDEIRLRSCQIINKIVDKLAGIDISLEVCERLEEALMQRLKDTKNTIREQAVITLYRLQDPSNPEDSIISELLFFMNNDICPKVRKLCVEKIVARKDVVAHMIKRVTDAQESVRLAALKRLTNLAKFLKIGERRQILQWLFFDKSEKVQDLTSTLINIWLNHYENNILKFLESIRFDASSSDIEETVLLNESILNIYFKNKTVAELFQQLPIDPETRLVPKEKLSWEVASYWRIYVEFLSNNEEFDEERDKVLPAFAQFSDYIKDCLKYISENSGAVAAVEFQEMQFVFKQLFLITRTYDNSDTWYRKCLNALVSYVLETFLLMADVIEVIVGTLERSIPNIAERIEFVTGIISEILYPMRANECSMRQQEKELQISQIKVNIIRLKHNLEEAVKNENYILAEEIKNQLEEEKLNQSNIEKAVPTEIRCEKRTDLATTGKCLDIAASILSSPQTTNLSPSLRSLKEDYIQDLLLHDNPSIQFKATKCYALCCTIDKSTATTGIHLFSTMILRYTNGEECNKETLCVSITAVTDLLRIYSSQLIAAPEAGMLSESMDEDHQAPFAGGTSLTEILQGIADMMDEDDNEIQEVAAKAICQLLLSDSVRSASLTSRLILKWCNPAVEPSLEVIIGHTLERLPLIPEQYNQFKEAVIFTIRTIVLAPNTSPFADIDVQNAAKFMLALLKTSPLSSNLTVDLCRLICSQIKRNPRSRVNPFLTKMFHLFDIPIAVTELETLLSICHEAKNESLVPSLDRQVVTNIEKFITSISKNLEGLSASLKMELDS